MEYKHDLEYLAELIDGLQKTGGVLMSLYLEKAEKCPFQEYDDEAFETNCNHPKVIREVNVLTDCRHCPYFTVREEQS